ncbi:hypothetical protein [Halosimplex pelagicum]|uniref:Uncharacterized protein n=1 Tax=Halosimplex pelagicum TaxID=869886 RepID=A0A7D5TWS5_9EURY|nr:hypothetical protein [Halosimplex pelagicum]QLH84234.1 hypothetical protein HZS54_22485 [Halosimplex pelagicum]
MTLLDSPTGLGILVVYLGALGLVGWVVYLKVGHRAHYGLSAFGLGGSSDTDPESMTNCPACGARNGEERTACRYCSEPLERERDESADRRGRLRSDETE